MKQPSPPTGLLLSLIHISPFIVNAASATGTGQLPKFAEDMFKLEGMDYYLEMCIRDRVGGVNQPETLGSNS